ncbi:hypothetical protein [Clostridioides sp. ES-S-0123-01]|uniref:hypothetical protein n=1 Tax=Clostridioides sp. ES-S-0123-01 TaxID=2770783 RepID=UPI001D12A839
MALSMSYFNLPDKREYTKNLAFNPFAGGRQNFGWIGGDHGLNGEFEETCLSCTYNGSTLNWGSGNVWGLGGYGQYTFTYNCESMHVGTKQVFPYTSDRIITIKGKPSISGIDNVLSDKRKGFSIDFSVNDDTPNANLTVYVSLDDKVIQTFNNVTNNANLTAIVTDEQINSFTVSTHQLKITLNDGYDNFYRIYSFWKKDKGINITSSATDKQAKFTVTKIYSELTKIECYLDETLKETFTTDLYSEKTINYELTDNAIHTLKIVVTDAENVVEEKVISISKSIMPLPTDANLQDISSKLVEIGEGFKNGKTSIINVLALKNIEASLNNTLVELSEKIKGGFDSGDASLQDLMNQLTQANNTITQLNTQISALNSKYKYAYSTDVTLHWFVDCGFRPDFVIYHCWTKSTQLLTIATPDKYFSFMNSSRGWAIIQSDPNDEYSFSENDTTRFFGTVFRENGFYCSDMPNDSLNDKYYFYYAIKCL